MKSTELKKWILSLTQDISFTYLGIDGSICPFASDNISMAYGDSVKDYTDINDLMNDDFFNGKSLNTISENIIID